MYASVSTYKTHLLIKDFLDKESENIWICMVERAGSYTFLYDGTGPVARLRRAEEALIEQTLQEMAVRAHAAHSYVAFFPTKRQIPPGRGPGPVN